MFDDTKTLTLVAVIGVVTLLWMLSAVISNTAIIDPFWGFGFVIVTSVYIYKFSSVWSFNQWVLASMIIVWGLRLSGYLLKRLLHEGIHKEDYRYSAFRRNDPEHYWWKSLLKVFWLQGLLIWIFSQLMQNILLDDFTQKELSSSTLFVIGVITWFIGLFFETVGDYQLQVFKANPNNRGKVLDSGLWSLTRHPNYFGDSMVWIGFALSSLGMNFSTTWYHLFLGPIAMVYLLVRVTGKPLLEKHLAKERPDYMRYIERTSSFIPMPSQLWRVLGSI